MCFISGIRYLEPFFQDLMLPVGRHYFLHQVKIKLVCSEICIDCVFLAQKPDNAGIIEIQKLYV